MALTNKQRAFVEHYLGDAQWNATKAAQRAGYAHPQQQGSRLLSNVVVKQHITDRLHAMGAATEALRARWLDRVGVDISPFVGKDGLDVEALKAAGFGFLIKGVRKTKDATTILLRDPDVAEDRLARHLGMFPTRLDVKHDGTLTVNVHYGRNRHRPAEAPRQTTGDNGTSSQTPSDMRGTESGQDDVGGDGGL